MVLARPGRVPCRHGDIVGAVRVQSTGLHSERSVAGTGHAETRKRPAPLRGGRPDDFTYSAPQRSGSRKAQWATWCDFRVPHLPAACAACDAALCAYVLATTLAANFSHLAYASGNAETCTAWMAWVADMRCQPGTSIRRLRNDCAAWCGFVTCAGVPQPDDGRCWNRPCESWSLLAPRLP